MSTAWGGSIGRFWNPVVKKLSLFSPLSDRNGGRLEAIAGFMPNYLQLNSTPAEVIRYLDERESARAGPGRLGDI